MSALQTVEVYKGDAKARINVSDLAAWKQGGWSDEKSASAAPVAPKPEPVKPS